jgi:hypothetical protein
VIGEIAVTRFAPADSYVLWDESYCEIGDNSNERVDTVEASVSCGEDRKEIETEEALRADMGGRLDRTERYSQWNLPQ